MKKNRQPKCELGSGTQKQSHTFGLLISIMPIFRSAI